MLFGPEVSAGQHRLGAGRKNATSCSREQNWGNLLILVFFGFQHPIPVKWPAKAQENEFVQFGPEVSAGQHRLGAGRKTPQVAPGAKLGNLLILVFFGFQHPIPVKWPAKAQENEFCAIRSRGKRRTASSWSRPKKCQKLLQGAKLG